MIRRGSHRVVVCVAGILAFGLLGGLSAGVSLASNHIAIIGYFGCQAKSGAVTHITTSSKLKCATGMTVVTWNQVGPQGVPGPKGIQGNQGIQGVTGPAGPGATYFAEDSVGTTSPQVITADVAGTGIGVQFVCGQGFLPTDEGLGAYVAAVWGDGTSMSPNTMTRYADTSGPISADGRTVAPLLLAGTPGPITAGTPSTGGETDVGFVMINQPPGIASQSEIGIAYTVHFSWVFTTTTQNCSITGDAIPLQGTRYLPLPIGVT